MKNLYILLVISTIFNSCSNPSKNKKDAENFYQKGDFNNALLAVNQAISYEPDSVTHYILRAMIYDQTGFYKDEITDLNTIFMLKKKKGNKAINLHFQLSYAKFMLGLYQDALNDINFYIDNSEMSNSLLEAYLQKASILYQLNELEEAKKFYNLALKENVKNNPVIKSNSLVGLSNIEKSPNKKLELLSKAIEINKYCDAAYGSRGVVLLEKNDLENAYIDLCKAIKIAPNNSLYYMNLAEFYSSYRRNSDSAIYYYKKATELAPDSPFNADNYMTIAVHYSWLEDYENSLFYFKKSDSLNPQNDIMLYNYSMLLSDMNRNEDALKKINRALKVNSKDAEYYNLKGLILSDLSNLKGAEDAYLFSIKLNSKNGLTFFNLANLFGDQNKHSEAIKNYDCAVNLNYDLKNTLVNRAIEKIKINKLSSACFDLKKAKKLGRNDIDPLINQYCN